MFCSYSPRFPYGSLVPSLVQGASTFWHFCGTIYFPLKVPGSWPGSGWFRVSFTGEILYIVNISVCVLCWFTAFQVFNLHAPFSLHYEYLCACVCWQLLPRYQICMDVKGSHGSAYGRADTRVVLLISKPSAWFWRQVATVRKDCGSCAEARPEAIETGHRPQGSRHFPCKPGCQTS